MAGLAALVVGVLLVVTGAGKLFSGAAKLRGQAVDTALERRLRIGRAVAVLRLTGGAELVLGGALLALPGAVTGGAVALLGLVFTGYLAWARATAPESSCGCTAADHAPIGVRAFSRAGLVAAGGTAVAFAPVAWWSYAGDRPVLAGVLVAVGAAVVVSVHADVAVPLRRLRLRLLGHPLGGDPAAVPVEGSVELLERSVAWETLNPLVRSGLLEHWDDGDGWRFLRYTGLYAASRPVSVVFALSSRARLGGPPPAIRVALIALDTGEVLPAPTPEPVG
ncbi:hypothetical protein SRB5_68270 [Streptomyces sp. RB5]|uniref:Methylamine utilisation protein MauE domain-containing protein n=1 Tax=Streptomyces smaragdinus TaxID=2585196 RepID=A0A7K0CT18_9ACTN|nr:MauE/DoxX family redox-associated membrane protein [Streptomyces smaragdinus]MQY16625.1 hypothetical protein [Streptomyces smaragdinus]